MNGEYILIETARIMADIEKENKRLQEEVEKLTVESTEWEERTYCWQDRAENLQIIIDKAIKYITSYESINTLQECEEPKKNKGLDEDTFIEMVRRYMIVHDKLLNILQGSDNNE